MPDQSLGTDHQSSQAVGHVGPSHGEKVAQMVGYRMSLLVKYSNEKMNISARLYM